MIAGGGRKLATPFRDAFSDHLHAHFESGGAHKKIMFAGLSKPENVFDLSWKSVIGAVNGSSTGTCVLWSGSSETAKQPPYSALRRMTRLTDFVVNVGDYSSATPTATFWDGRLRPASLRVAAFDDAVTLTFRGTARSKSERQAEVGRPAWRLSQVLRNRCHRGLELGTTIH